MRNKINLSKKIFISILVISMIFIGFATFKLFWDLSNNYQAALNSGILESEKEKINEFAATRTRINLISFISASLFVISFIVYSLFALNKVQVGYVYIFLWIIMWAGFAFAPVIIKKEFTLIELPGLLCFIGICVTNFFLIKEIQELKNFNKINEIKNKQFKL